VAGFLMDGPTDVCLFVLRSGASIRVIAKGNGKGRGGRGPFALRSLSYLFHLIWLAAVMYPPGILEPRNMGFWAGCQVSYHDLIK